MRLAKPDIGSRIPDLLGADPMNDAALRESVTATIRSFLERLTKRRSLGDISDHVEIVASTGEEPHTLVIDLTSKTPEGYEIVRRIKEAQAYGAPHEDQTSISGLNQNAEAR